jgi:tetratricopeptide (TPR) repeat protein
MLKKLSFPILVVILVTGLNSGCLAQTTNTLQRADNEFKAGNFERAAELYNQLIENDAQNSQYWQKLGAAYYRLQEYDKAIVAMTNAERNGAKENLQLTAIKAFSYAELNQKNKAFTYLEKLAALGFSPKAMANHPKLAGLKDDPRFKKLLAKADKMAYPCKYDPKNRQFDFWVGNWNVYVNGKKVAESHIQNLLEGCLILENYHTLSGGFAGKSMNYYNSKTGKWEQIWTDVNGQISRYEGELEDGEMHFLGTNISKDGNTNNVRMVFTPNPDGTVRQLFESSSDSGKTWNVSFDGIYKPMNGKDGMR